MGRETNKVVDETSSGRNESGLACGMLRDCRHRERKVQNKIQIVFVQAPVPLRKIHILLDKQLALLLDGMTLSEPFKEGGPIVVPPSGRGVFSKHPSHYVPDEIWKALEEISIGHGFVNRFPLAQWLDRGSCDWIQGLQVSREKIGVIKTSLTPSAKSNLESQT